MRRLQAHPRYRASIVPNSRRIDAGLNFPRISDETVSATPGERSGSPRRTRAPVASISSPPSTRQVANRVLKIYAQSSISNAIAFIEEVRRRLPIAIQRVQTDNVLSARRWSGAETQHPSGGSGSRCPVRPRRTQAAQWSSASEKDPAAHSEHRVRARAEPALTVLNTA